MSLAIGHSAGYINGIENGRSFPSMEVFFYICEYLEITPKDFFDIETKNYIARYNEEEIRDFAM